MLASLPVTELWLHVCVGLCVKSRLLVRCLQLLSLNASAWIPLWMIVLFKHFIGEISTKQSAWPSGMFECALFVKLHICVFVCKHVQADWHLLRGS